MDPALADFGAMLAAYVTAADGDQSIIIEVDYVANDSGNKDLPMDLSHYVRLALVRIGKPLEAYRKWPSILLATGPAAYTLPLLPDDRPKPPQPTFRLVGSLLRASERLAKGRDASGYALLGGGHTQTDAQAKSSRTRTLTDITVLLTLEYPNGVAVPGAAAEYRIYVERSESDSSFSVFVGGTGIGGGTKATVTQDAGAGIYEAVAMSVMHLLGNALLVPYDRCSPLFVRDQALDERARDAFSGLTRSGLEQNIKRYLFVQGYPLDKHGPDLTAEDRAIVTHEVHLRSLVFDSREDMVRFAMELWRTLDYHKGAQTVHERIIITRQAAVESIEQAAKRQRELAVGPLEFGWSPLLSIVVLDLSHIQDSHTRDRILAIVRPHCDEMRLHPTKMLVGLRISVRPFEIQQALRASRLRLGYAWFDAPTPRLVVVPAADAAAVAR